MKYTWKCFGNGKLFSYFFFESLKQIPMKEKSHALKHILVCSKVPFQHFILFEEKTGISLNNACLFKYSKNCIPMWSNTKDVPFLCRKIGLLFLLQNQVHSVNTIHNHKAIKNLAKKLCNKKHSREFFGFSSHWHHL